VGEAIAAAWDIEVIIYSAEKLDGDFAKQLLSEFPGRIERVSLDVLQSIADKDNPQGILAVVRQKRSSLENIGTIRRAAALVAPQDPGNLGTIARTLDAIGADGLFLLDGGADAYHPTAIRASMGSLFWIPAIEASFSAFNRWRLDVGSQLIGTSASANHDYRNFEPGPSWILLLGSEQKGLSQDQLEMCDVTLSLPMRGRSSSLNLAVAAGIFLYHLR
jgi:TrmH family RNA methyltransferase